MSSWKVVKNRKRLQTGDVCTEEPSHTQPKQCAIEKLLTADTNTKINDYIDDMCRQYAVTEKLAILKDTALSVLSQMRTLVNKSVRSLDYNQESAISISNYEEIVTGLQSELDEYCKKLNDTKTALLTKKDDVLTEIKKQLTGLGLEEKEQPSTYKNVLGSMSDLVINKKENIVHANVNHPTDLYKFLTINEDVSAIDINGTIFTIGECNFVDLKMISEKTRYAKRCLNDNPCKYKSCHYYHDPATVANDYNKERNFAISYIVQMINTIKTTSDVDSNASVKNIVLLRDLVQLGGSLIIKAARIHSLYFNKK